MPSKTKDFRYVKFRPEDLKEALVSFINEVPSEIAKRKRWWGSVTATDTTWRFENEDEFYAEYRMATTTSSSLNMDSESSFLELTYFGHYTEVKVSLPSRPQVERVFEVFEKAKEAGVIPVKFARPRIFIGHGRHTDWRDLKDHLHEKHGFDVEAYETGARAGYTITEFLKQ